jgi:hypothetical protein
MKIGDYVTIQAIKDQSECRWVVLSDLVHKDYGYCFGTDGGVIRFIGDNEEAGDAAAELENNGISTLIIRGAIEPLSVGGVFVE